MPHDDATSDHPRSDAPMTGAETAHDAPVRTGIRHSSDPSVPEAVGPFTIEHEIGEGGMGTVYLARQHNPDREVALKLIRPGYASRKLLKRFDLEAQMLGRLQHPSIAQIYQAGTYESGRGPQPYFAMELVRGEPLDVYVESHGLGTRARLELLAKVADAVHHAHAKGVIHRDLKPSNILVTEDGQPKILDFGVARATDSDVQVTTIQTDVGQIIGTIPYMSPEQISGDPSQIDVRSDVYALGVVLYEILAGRMPYDLQQRMIHDAARIIREDDPTPLSTINRTLRGDIETIASKSLEKTRDRRYQSAGELADDIRRYLDNKPIVARPPSTLYQLSKFARRNRILVGGIVAVFLVLVAGIAVSTVQAVRAKRAESAARTSLAEAEATVEFLDSMLGAVDPGAMGKDVTVRAVLDQSSGSIDTEFADRPLVAARLHSTIGRTYTGLGDYGSGMEHTQRALDLRTQELGPNHPDTLRARTAYAMAMYRAGDYAGAKDALVDALADETRLLGRSDPVTVECITMLASVYSLEADLDNAIPLLREAIALNTQLYGVEAEPSINAMNSLAIALIDVPSLEEAESLSTRAVAAATKLFGPEHPNTLDSMSNLAWIYEQQKKSDEAIALGERTLEAKARVLGHDHPETNVSRANLAISYKRVGRLEEAEPLLRDSLEIDRKTLGEDHPNYLIGLTNLARFLGQRGDTDEAITLFDQSLAGHIRALGPDSPGTGFTALFYADCLYDAKKYAESEQRFLEAKRIFDGAFDPEHPLHAQIIQGMIKLYDAWGRPEDADRLRATLPTPDADAATG